MVSKRPIWPVAAACSVTARPPTIQRIQGSVSEPVGIVHVLVPGKLRQAESVVQFTEGEQTRVGGELGTVELQHRAAGRRAIR